MLLSSLSSLAGLLGKGLVERVESQQVTEQAKQAQQKLDRTALYKTHDVVELSQPALRAMNSPAPTASTEASEQKMPGEEVSAPATPVYKTVGTQGVFDIEANLDVTTPKPPYPENYDVSPMWNPGLHKIVMTREEVNQQFLTDYGKPLDYQLDKDFKEVDKMLEHIDQAQQRYDEAMAMPMGRGRYRAELATERLGEYQNTLQTKLQSMHEKYSEQGIGNYTQEVFLKRSQQFGERVIDLAQLNQELQA